MTILTIDAQTDTKRVVYIMPYLTEDGANGAGQHVVKALSDGGGGVTATFTLQSAAAAEFSSSRAIEEISKFLRS